MSCDHDLKNPVRKGRGWYECRKCGTDITLALVMYHESKGDYEREEKKKMEKKK